MLILALDTCDARGSIALLRGGEILALESHTTSEDYSSWLLPATTRLLTPKSFSLRDIELYAVASGPGSFTGVRMALTSVKAWSEVYARPIAAVSRLQALASQSIGSAPFVAACVDARRNQVFAALYRRHTSGPQLVDAEMVIAPGDFLDWCASQAETQRIDWISTDPDCLTQTPGWPSRLALAESLQTISPPFAPVIGQIGYLLARENRLTDALALDANYVRRSDAELFWKGQANHGA